MYTSANWASFTSLLCKCRLHVTNMVASHPQASPSFQCFTLKSRKLDVAWGRGHWGGCIFRSLIVTTCFCFDRLSRSPSLMPLSMPYWSTTVSVPMCSRVSIPLCRTGLPWLPQKHHGNGRLPLPSQGPLLIQTHNIAHVYVCVCSIHYYSSIASYTLITQLSRTWV